MLITVLFPMPRARMTAQNSPNTHSVNKPSLLASLFKKEKKKTHKKNKGIPILSFDLVWLFACSAFVFSLHVVVGIVLLFPFSLHVSVLYVHSFEFAFLFFYVFI